MKQLLGRTGLVWYLSLVRVASELVIPERLGTRLCMVQCLRYNRCFGVKMSVATMTCTLLDNRHTDGNIMDVSQSSIIQTMRTGHTCIASKHYKRLFCLVNSKGQKVDLTDHTASPEDTIIRDGVCFKKASLHNCRSSVGSLSIIPELATRLHVNETYVGMVDRGILPGTRHLINLFPWFEYPSFDVAETIKLKYKFFTVAVTDTPTVNFNRMGWNITYFYDFTSGKYEAQYNSLNRSKLKMNITKSDLTILLDRSSSGDVLLDVDTKTETLLGSAPGPNLNQTMWIVIQLYLPANVRLNKSFKPPSNLEKILYGWYQHQVI